VSQRILYVHSKDWGGAGTGAKQKKGGSKAPTHPVWLLNLAQRAQGTQRLEGNYEALVSWGS